MKHLGDITKINGAVIETVDCVCGGSPCQDLSVAGKRAGLAGKRSGLYMEQIRIIKEMRKADELRGRTGIFIRPRYMVWENVPGAFSSNGGKDFAAVLEEAIRIAEPEAPDVPVPKKGWPSAGCLYDDLGDGQLLGEYTMHSFGECHNEENVSHLSQILEAFPHPKYYLSAKACRGILNRANRRGKQLPEPLKIALETQATLLESGGGCDGGGKGALVQTERSGTLGTNQDQTLIILGKTYCIQGNVIDRSDTAGCNGKGRSEDKCYTLNTIDRPAVVALNDQGGTVMSVSEDKVGTLRAQEHGNQPIVVGGFCYKASAADGSIGYQEEVCPTLKAGQQMAVYDARGNGDGEIVPTLTGDHENRVTDYTAICIGNGQAKQSIGEVAGSLNCMHDQQVIMAVDCRNFTESEINGTLQAKETGGTSLNLNNVIRCFGSARRLTPLECERLQGYPDGWTNIGEWEDSKGKRHKEADTPRYKALGNSIALPFWFWLLRRISAQYARPATMGSLFDGIGGFPLCWERCNGKGTARWASEIEEFPIAVTKVRFPEPVSDG